MSMTYFDNSATTRVDPRVREVMDRYHDESYGNAGSMHWMGIQAGKALDEARASVARSIGASPREIVFTSGGTESDNLALQGFAFANRGKGDHIVTTAIEHHAILNTCEFLESQGFRVTYLPVDKDGSVSVDDVQRAMSERTILVSVMAANNEIGTVQNIREIGGVVRERKVAFHTDAVQSLCKVPIDVGRDNIDLLSISGHKFHGPKGVGALFVRKGITLRPIFYGGGHERGMRSSTENVPGIIGMAKALELGIAEMDESVPRMASIRDRIIEGVLSSAEGCRLNGHRTARLCNNVNFSFEGVEGQALVLVLSSEGFMTSTGSACSSKSLEPSHVLKAIGLANHQARGSLRISLSKFSTMDEAKAFLDVMPDVLGKVRFFSAQTPLGSRS
ncbi:MAG: cysteine desulfurase [Euryarchaeota archaeon]|nr:cysteine desulfurase [Euryarchaeota archaeon]